MRLIIKRVSICLSLLSILCSQTYAMRTFCTWDNLLESSDYIVWAKVTEVQKQDDGKATTTFSVVRTYKGNPPDTLTLEWGYCPNESKSFFMDADPDGVKHLIHSSSISLIEDAADPLEDVSDDYLLFLRNPTYDTPFLGEHFMKKQTDGSIPMMCFFYLKSVPEVIKSKLVTKKIGNLEIQQYKWDDVRDWLEANFAARDGNISSVSLTKNKPTSTEGMLDFEIDIDLILEHRKKSSRMIDYSLTLEGVAKKSIKEAIHEMDRIAAADLLKEERQNRFRDEYGKLNKSSPVSMRALTALYLLELLPELETEDARGTCITWADHDGDSRCIDTLKSLLNSTEVSLSEKNRYAAYKVISKLGGPSQTAYLRGEYSADKCYWERWALATELALYGDSTGTPTLIEILEKNEDKDTREYMRQLLVKLYGVNHGTDIDAWNTVCGDRMPLNGGRNDIPSK